MRLRDFRRFVLLIGVLVSIVACGSPTGGMATTATPAVAGPAATGAVETAASTSTSAVATIPAVATNEETSPAATITSSPAATAQETATTAAGTTATAGSETVTPTVNYGRTLTIMTHDSFDASADVIAEFEKANKVNLRFLKSGDAGTALNKAILAKGSPLADVFYGVDNTFFSRAIGADIFEPYKPATLQHIPADLQLDPQGRLVPVDFGFVNFNYDRAAFGAGKLAVPQTLRDLTRPEYKGKIVVESPATSSPGLAFLLATVATFGESGDYPWTKYWADLRANDVQVVDGWETAYNTNFSGSSGKGPQPIVLSYATSPAAEVFYSEGKLAEPPTANIIPPKGAFKQIEFVGLLKGTKNRELAQRWIDYMTGPRFQADVPLKMFVYPANSQAPLPDLFRKFAPVPAEPAILSPDEIAAKRDRWIQEWTRIVQK